MASHPLWLLAVVAIAAPGAFHAAPAQARSSVVISVGTHVDARYVDPRHGAAIVGGYGHQRPGYVFVPGHWAHTAYGRVWVPAQYVPVQPHYRYRPDPRVIHRQPSRGYYPLHPPQLHRPPSRSYYPLHPPYPQRPLGG